MNHNRSSSTECSWDKLPFSFVRGQDSTMWDIIWVSPQGHRSVSVSHHFLLQAPQCPCSVRKRFSRDHRCRRERSKPGCRIVGSDARWELTTWADFQLCLHWFLMSAGCTSSHSSFLDVSRRNGGLRISGWSNFLDMHNAITTKLPQLCCGVAAALPFIHWYQKTPTHVALSLQWSDYMAITWLTNSPTLRKYMLVGRTSHQMALTCLKWWSKAQITIIVAAALSSATHENPNNHCHHSQCCHRQHTKTLTAIVIGNAWKP